MSEIGYSISLSASVLEVRGIPASCRPGWYPLIRELDADLSAIDPHYRVTDIKEKYGHLAFHADPVTRGTDCNAFYDRIDRAENESKTVCELCGRTPARIVGGSWLAARCRACEP